MRFLGIFFRQLYGLFAWTYDFVADSVSIGRWRDWIRIVLPYLRGTNILELGHGPGHLQHNLMDRLLVTIGLDRSRQMGKIAKKRLLLNGYAKFKLTSGEAQNLPFKNECFDTIFATFPTEYFYDSRTLEDVWRTLKNGGRYIVLPFAWITGNGILDRAAAWLFRVTGQVPSDLRMNLGEGLFEPIKDAGFCLQVELVELKSSKVLIVIATKED
jgi:ubiquinone/menaquinone biosynthesis C-methylase UbiE